MTNTKRVRGLLNKNPDMKVDEVMKLLNISKPYAFNLLSVCRKRLGIVKSNDGIYRFKKIHKTPAPTGSLNKAPSIVQEHFPITMEADPVNHPTHYKVGGIETIDFIEGKNLGYNLGNAVKYISRADHKGNRLQDLQKAQWYLSREIANTQS
jgi:hypothetical protein